MSTAACYPEKLVVVDATTWNKRSSNMSVSVNSLRNLRNVRYVIRTCNGFALVRMLGLFDTHISVDAWRQYIYMLVDPQNWQQNLEAFIARFSRRPAFIKNAYCSNLFISV